MEVWKEIITVDNMTLFVSVLTLVVAFATSCVTIKSYRYTRKRDKVQREELIRRKEAQLKAMNDASKIGISYNEIGSIMVNQAALRAEIEQLKKSL